MSSKGYVQSLLNPLDPEIKRLLYLAFTEAMDHDALGSDAKATNFDWFRVSSTTHTTANTEFSIAHGMDHAPTTLIPVLDLTAVNAQIVPLQVSRAADLKRVYLKSTSTGAVFTCYLE